VDTNVLELFWRACGAAGPLELQIDEGAEGRTACHRLDQPFALIGREGAVDVCLTSPAIGKRQLYVQVIDGRAFAVNLADRTDVFWGEAAQPSGWLIARAARVGPYTVQATGGSASAADDLPNPLAALGAEADHLPPVTLELLGGIAPEPPWAMNRVLALVGKTRACKVNLASSTVSTYHCALLRTPLGLWAVDLLGRGGVHVNGQRIRYARLASGDRIHVGRFILRVEYAAGDAFTTACQPANVAEGAEPPTRRAESDQRSAVPLPALRATEIPALAPSAVLVPASESADAAALTSPVVAAMLGQMRHMQEHMFDQMQQSMLMMMRMFGTLHRDQIGLIRDELRQINELTSKLATLQAEMARPRPAAPTDPARRLPDVRPTPSFPVPRPPAPAEQRPGEAAKSPTTPSPATAGPTAPSADVHAWLSAQIEAIQQERQTRWEKLMNFFSRQ
jgi:hypothetical protein